MNLFIIMKMNLIKINNLKLLIKLQNYNKFFYYG
jgi:hypothetical protein